MEKYSWDFNPNAEIWHNDAHDTIEECIADAKGTYPESKVVYIGENVPFDFTADSTDILERLEEKAYESCGEVGADWNAFDPKKREELNELDEKLTVVVKDWMAKYGYTPNFYAVMNISEHRLKEE